MGFVGKGRWRLNIYASDKGQKRFEAMRGYGQEDGKEEMFRAIKKFLIEPLKGERKSYSSGWGFVVGPKD